LQLTTRDENGDLVTPLLNNKLAEVVLTPSTPLQTISGNIESDKDSGVAIELNSLDATSGNIPV
jgi:hypothetical protein